MEPSGQRRWLGSQLAEGGQRGGGGGEYFVLKFPAYTYINSLTAIAGDQPVDNGRKLIARCRTGRTDYCDKNSTRIFR